MQNDWFMILTIGWAGAPRCAVTAWASFDHAGGAALETLAADPDAERVYVLRGQREPTGMRSWQNVVGWRRPRSGEETENGGFPCVLEKRELPALSPHSEPLSA